MSKISKALSKAKENGYVLHVETPQLQIQSPAQKSDFQPNYVFTQVQKPDIKTLKKNRILTAIKDQKVHDAYSLLRTQLTEKMISESVNCLMVTSPGPQEGKTLTAINLGLSLVKDARRTVLLVDTNLRDPKVHTYLGLTCNKGLTDYLLNGTDLQDVLISPNIPGFVVLPAGDSDQCSTEMLNSSQMKVLVTELKRRYPNRCVLFDSPHIVDMPDSLVFSSYVDGVIMVVQPEKTRSQDIQESLRLFAQRNVVGVVMNNMQY